MKWKAPFMRVNESVDSYYERVVRSMKYSAPLWFWWWNTIYIKIYRWLWGYYDKPRYLHIPLKKKWV